MVVAVPEGLRLRGARCAQGARLRVATKYVQHRARALRREGRARRPHPLYGSMELAPLVGLADAIVDLVATGSTLQANELCAVEEIMPVSARLIVNQAALKLKRAALQPLIEAFAQGASRMKLRRLSTRAAGLRRRARGAHALRGRAGPKRRARPWRDPRGRARARRRRGARPTRRFDRNAARRDSSRRARSRTPRSRRSAQRARGAGARRTRAFAPSTSGSCRTPGSSPRPTARASASR